MARQLDHLIELARKYRSENELTDDERNRQVRSFAFGNTHFENAAITKTDIDEAMNALRAEHRDTICS